jgi:acetyl-CoA acetyltransferase
VLGFDKHPPGAFNPSPEEWGIGSWYGETGLMLTTQFFAMKIQRYMAEHGISESTLAKVATKAFENGSLNPNAWRRRPLSEQEVLASKMVNHPLTQYMFCSPDEGAAAVVVSNHGGRQLDCVSPTLRALPEVVAAVGDKTEVLMDGGIRRGGDIVKAICLGARAVLIGRAYAYGLAAAGEAGVTRAIQILTADLERTLRLLGCSSIRELDPSYVEVPAEWMKKS